MKLFLKNKIFVVILLLLTCVILLFGLFSPMNNRFITMTSADIAMAHSLYISNGNALSAESFNTLKIIFSFPLYNYIILLFFLLLKNWVCAAKCTAVLLSISTVLALYQLMKKYHSAKSAFVTALLYIFTPVFFFYSNQPLRNMLLSLLLIGNIYVILKIKGTVFNTRTVLYLFLINVFYVLIFPSGVYIPAAAGIFIYLERKSIVKYKYFLISITASIAAAILWYKFILLRLSVSLTKIPHRSLFSIKYYSNLITDYHFFPRIISSISSMSSILIFPLLLIIIVKNIFFWGRLSSLKKILTLMTIISCSVYILESYVLIYAPHYHHFLPIILLYILLIGSEYEWSKIKNGILLVCICTFLYNIFTNLKYYKYYVLSPFYSYFKLAENSFYNNLTQNNEYYANHNEIIRRIGYLPHKNISKQIDLLFICSERFFSNTISKYNNFIPIFACEYFFKSGRCRKNNKISYYVLKNIERISNTDLQLKSYNRSYIFINGKIHYTTLIKNSTIRSVYLLDEAYNKTFIDDKYIKQYKTGNYHSYIIEIPLTDCNILPGRYQFCLETNDKKVEKDTLYIHKSNLFYKYLFLQ